MFTCMSNTGYKYIYSITLKGCKELRYQVRLFVAHKNIYVKGTYKTLDEAVEARKKYLEENEIKLYLQK